MKNLKKFGELNERDEQYKNVISDDRIQNALHDAQLAFWASIADEFRTEIKSGDFPPDATVEFDKAQEKAVRLWLSINYTK